MEDNMDLAADEDYKLRSQTTDEKDKEAAAPDIEEFRVQMTLSDEQETRLTDSFFSEFEAIERERLDLKLPDKWKEKDAQYDGSLAPNERLLFNLNVHQSKIKVNAIVRAMAKAYLSGGQIADISPRPDMAQTKNGYDICDAQSEFLDYAFDEEIKPENDLRKVWTDAAKKFVGICKVDWSYRRETRKRFETYEGKNTVTPMGPHQIVENEGLQKFLEVYPDAGEKYKSLLKRLVEEKQIDIVVEYKDVINNNVKFRHIKLENFYVRNGCEYWEGLRTEHCIGEEQEYTYWELMKKQKDGAFKNVEKIWAGSQTNADDNSTSSADYKTATYKIIEGTYYFKLKDSDEDEVKMKCWFSREKKIFLGAILFPWYAIDVDYVPFYLRLNDYGFYGNCLSVMDDLKDSHICQNALLSLLCHGTYVRNIQTPIVKEGSTLEALFLEKDFVEGMPLPVDEFTQDVSKELGFVQWPQLNANEIMGVIGFSQRMDGNVTGISDAAATGANDPTDPSAPAHKTIALLQASGINIEDYIECSLPSFNILMTYTFQLYYQMSNEDRKYRVRRKSEGVVGTDPFKTITRDQLIAKTSVESRAAGFVFEKAQERQDAMAGMQAVMTNPYAARIPDVQYKSLMVFLEALGPRWRNFAETELPSPQELDAQLQKVAFQAVAQFMNQAQQAQQTTGVAPKINPQQIKGVVHDAQVGAYNPDLAKAAQEAGAK